MIAARSSARGTVCLPGVPDVEMPTSCTFSPPGSFDSRMVATDAPMVLALLGTQLGPPEPSVYAQRSSSTRLVKSGVDVVLKSSAAFLCGAGVRSAGRIARPHQHSYLACCWSNNLRIHCVERIASSECFVNAGHDQYLWYMVVLLLPHVMQYKMSPLRDSVHTPPHTMRSSALASLNLSFFISHRLAAFAGPRFGQPVSSPAPRK